MKKYQLYVQECDIRQVTESLPGFPRGQFEANTRSEVFRKLAPLNKAAKGQRYYMAEEIEEAERPIIKRTVAV